MGEYQHNRTAWPHFTWDERALLAPLCRVHRRLGVLMERLSSLGAEVRQEAELSGLTDEAVHSSAIEGEHLSAEEVRSSLARRLGVSDAPAKAGARREDGVAFVTADATLNAATPLTEMRLFDWHRHLFEGSGAAFPLGQWRTSEMEVVSGPVGRQRVHYRAPEAARVPSEMAAFLGWFNSGADTARGFGGPSVSEPITKAAIAHLWFVSVHPFDDGNGRIARAVADLALARLESGEARYLGMSARIRHDRDAYYRILESTQSGDSLDVSEWMLWFVAELSVAVEDALSALSRAVFAASFWARAAAVGLNERQKRIAALLLDGFEGKLTSGKYAKIAKCSPDTAARDLAQMVERGLLARSEAGGRSTSYRLAQEPSHHAADTDRPTAP